MELELVTCDAYGRKSTKDKAASIAGQLDVCTALIPTFTTARQRWEVGEIYIDPEKSASRFAKKRRPDFDAMFAAYRAYTPKPGTRRAIAIWECSRGSRQISEWSAFVELLRDRQMLVVVGESEEVLDPTKWRDFKRLIDEGLAAHGESDKMSMRLRRGNRSAALEGRPQGRLVYGYAREYDERGEFVKQIEHPAHGPVVKTIFKRIVAGDSLHEIVHDLNDDNIAPPHGKQWYLSAVRRIGMRTSYLGQRVHLGSVVATDCWPALIDPETFKKSVRILDAPGRQTANVHGLQYQCSGIIRCSSGGCQGVLHAKWQKRGYMHERVRLYQCKKCGGTSIVGDHIDGFVEMAVHEYLQTQEAAWLFELAPVGGEAADAAAEEQVLKARLDGHYAAAAVGDLTAGGLAVVEKAILAQIDVLQKKQRAASAPAPLAGQTPQQIVDSWQQLTVARRREIINAAADLVVGRGKPGRPGFDVSRLGECRWRNDPKTWAQRWADREFKP